MLSTDMMRPFQTLYNRTQFLAPQIRKLYKSFHSTEYRFDKEPSTVSTFFDPVTGGILTRRVAESEHTETENEKNPISSKTPGSDYADGLKDDRSYGSVMKGNLGSGSGSRRAGFGVSKKKSKKKTTWVCSDCGYNDGQWWGYCRECKSVGTMNEFTEIDNGGKTSGFQVSENIVRSWLPKGSTGEAGPLRLTDVNRGVNHLEWRFPLQVLFTF